MSNVLWQSVLGEIELSISHAAFTAWFPNTQLLSQSDEEVIIAVPNIFAKRQFEVKFDTQIREILKKNGVSPTTVTYTVPTKSSRPPLVNREVDITESTSTSRETSISRIMPSPLSPSGLNPRYTFDNFIVGGSNDLAYAASQAVAANPGTKYNPLFLYGGVGLGKTHLTQAIGNEIMKHQSDAHVLYVTTETFVSEFINGVRFKKNGILEKYRNVDVLIIDDIQFIADKQATQEGFFHTFNALHQANKQIVITSDKPPKSIPTLTERLRSRFEWGMSIDIQMPDYETRQAIVETKASLTGTTLEREVVEYLATNFKTNVRELEGALNQLLAYAEMRGITPDAATAQALIGNIRYSRPQHLTPKQVVDKTAKHFAIDTKEMCSAKRDKHIVVPRQIAMYLLRSELHLSFPKIASELGRKDHTTAIHSIEKIERAIKLDTIMREHVAEIREHLYA